jgi:hypothetical protein
VLSGIVYIDIPSQSDVNKMKDQLFGGIDEDDGLDKAFEAIQSMRGNILREDFLPGYSTNSCVPVL